MDDTRRSPVSLQEWLLERYGPTMTHREVAESLKLKPETLRRKMWAQRHLPWIRALRRAMCSYQGRDRVYRTTHVAQIIEERFPENLSPTEC